MASLFLIDLWPSEWFTYVKVVWFAWWTIQADASVCRCLHILRESSQVNRLKKEGYGCNILIALRRDKIWEAHLHQNDGDDQDDGDQINDDDGGCE